MSQAGRALAEGCQRAQPSIGNTGQSSHLVTLLGSHLGAVAPNDEGHLGRR